MPRAPGELALRTLATKPSIRVDDRAGNGGKTAVNRGRWVSERGKKGLWSEIAAAA